MPRLTLDGHSLYYAFHQPAFTSRPPLVLIHGAGGQYLHWPPQVRRLSATTVYAPDLPGHGRSEGAGQETIADYATVMLAFLDALEIEQAVVTGHSMGGAVALTLALEAPDRVAGLVLVATGARLRVAPAILEHIHDDFKGVVETVLQWAYSPNAPEDLLRLGRKHMLDNTPAVLYGDFLACDTFDVRERLVAITTPTLVVGGSADRMTPPKFSSLLAEQIVGAQLHILENAGHMLIVEQPDEVARVMQAWLRSRWE